MLAPNLPPEPQAGNLTEHVVTPLPTSDCSGNAEDTSLASGSTEFKAPGLDSVAMVKGRRGWSYLPGIRLEHNLHWAAGLLELANSGDFAANIWNDVPVPVYAIVFMAIGGTVAALISIFALRDGGKAWKNVKFLRHQRHLLRTQRAQQLEECQSTEKLDVLIDITTRELYTEAINRWGMDMLMGGGAVLISIGTFMAIGGANRRVWLASNILSGYLGNAPIALFGLVNFCWAIYMWTKKQSHYSAATKKLQDTPALSVVKEYCFNMRLFFAINGTSTLIGGVGSMLTPTFWWAYVVLIPVIISSYFCNFWWRRRVGYDRPVLNFPIGMNSRGLVQALEFAEETRRVMKKDPEAATMQLVTDPTSLLMVLNRFVEHGLFESFATRLINNKDIRQVLCGEQGTRAEIEVSQLLALPESYRHIVLSIAGTFLQNEGPKHFEHRTRFLAEILGTYLAMVEDDSSRHQEEKVGGKEGESL
ncbi:hypothetical protein B0T10DRAFT_492157 [Thelonectria olida]|uniref:Integral membrane protein n=1 Tax=Thelonectria olida TaxID=1576542 RepID=A0A9P8VYF5_9HYPO|nr:hypothetical protein B0T10DRAFT_492157 [Thelonectria olida]